MLEVATMPDRRRGPKSGQAGDNTRKHKLYSLSALCVLGFAAGAVQGQPKIETADVMGQGPNGPVVAADGATLRRSENGLTVTLRMSTPVPGTYMYPGPSMFQPEGALVGHPEAYSLWVFAFNAPDGCAGSPCNIDDFNAGRGMGGAFNAAGHVSGGPLLQFSGRVTMNDSPFRGTPLLEPTTAEVHVAVAPHGVLQPDVLPAQIKTPIGAPTHWWLAFFLND